MKIVALSLSVLVVALSLPAAAADAQQVRLARAHLHEIRAQFLKGDYSGPSHIHGADAMAGHMHHDHGAMKKP